MRKRWTWVAWGCWRSAVSATPPGLPLSVANGTFRRDLGDTLILRAVFAAFLVVGCLILARRPGNVIGWTSRLSGC